MKPGLTGMGSIILRNEEDILYESEKGKVRCYARRYITPEGRSGEVVF